jgi:RHS repeat-associated protein
VTTGSGAGTQTYTYDDRDRLLTENATSYGWDANDNLTSKSGEATYTWDFENRLVRVDLADGSAIEHLYDADGNRVKTTVTPSGGTGSITHYLVDTCGGGSCNGGLSHVIAETDGINALTALYVRLGDELIAVMRPDGLGGYVTRWVHHDGIGSVRALTDETAAVTDTRAYEAFGVENRRVGADPIAYGFAGEPFQGESRLAYHRARWIDPTVGRFAGVDPREPRPPNTYLPVGGSPYLYARGGPVSRIDPTGEVDSGSIGGMTAAITGAFASMAQPTLPITKVFWRIAAGDGDIPPCAQLFFIMTLNLMGTELNDLSRIRVNDSTGPGHAGEYVAGSVDYNSHPHVATIYVDPPSAWNKWFKWDNSYYLGNVAHELRHVFDDVTMKPPGTFGKLYEEWTKLYYVLNPTDPDPGGYKASSNNPFEIAAEGWNDTARASGGTQCWMPGSGLP